MQAKGHLGRTNLGGQRFTAVLGSGPIWGGNAKILGGNCPPLPHAGYGPAAAYSIFLIGMPLRYRMLIK